MESSTNKVLDRRNGNNTDSCLVTRSNGHEYSLRSTGRPLVASLAESVQPEEESERAPSCPVRPPSRRGYRKNRRNFRRHFTKAFFPVLFMTAVAATYFLIEWRVEALRVALDDLVADSSLLRDHFLSLSELLNEQVRLVEDRVADRLLTQLWLRDNDKTGIADFALESAGAEIVSTNGTEPWPSSPTFLEAALRPNPRGNEPRQLLRPGMSPGDCWAFRGSKGEAIIRLVTPLRITSVSIEHISKNISPTGSITSAPREFEIVGLQETDGEEEVLGRFIYQTSDPSLQTFHLPVPSATTPLVGFRILSNHGHPAYTCVYRLRVHGDLPTPGQGKHGSCDKPH